MDGRTELEQERGVSEGLEQNSSAVAETGSAPPGPARSPAPIVEEASFLVLESGKIRFFARPRVELEAPRTLEDVQRFSFSLSPRNRSVVRRISIGRKRMPDTRVRERHWAYVDRVGKAADVVSDLGPRTYMTKTLGPRTQSGIVEVASGTYAIASHRDHVHLLYELDQQSQAVTAELLAQLRIVPRASYIAAVVNPESKWRVRDRGEEPEEAEAYSERTTGNGVDEVGQRRFTPLDPVFLDHEGTELVLIGGGQSEVDQMATWARS
jgi:hypothetical protein